MSSNSLSRSQTSTSFGRGDLKPLPMGRSSFRIHHYPNNSQIPSIGSSPRTRPSPWSSYSNNGSGNDYSWRDTFDGDISTPLEPQGPRRRQRPEVPKSSGLIYCIKAKKELASIDKINDPSTNGLLCAGKAHLGYYKFSEEDRSIACVHDYMTTDSYVPGSSFYPMKKRGRQTKLSTIADVKTGFFSHNNYAAICHNSTAVSVYDLNKTSSLDNPLVTTLCEHTRSVNSFDFNSVQTNLLISGGQDGCVKVWDLRSSSIKKNKSDVNISAVSDSIRDVKWMPIQNYSQMGLHQDMKNGNNAGYKFASIQDSGLLLISDLRQPGQVEKRINAHTGLGLSLNWHPNSDYIATGGRDGRCCLWYVGDKPQYESSSHTSHTPPIHNSHGMNTTGSTSLAFLPEVTINAGVPVTKLKFCPNYQKDVLNACLALSSTNEEASVNIFSLARKYIPKHVLLTTSPSLGMVWWDDKLIFSIDKDDHITGWDTRQEPTVLENLPKRVTRWRDIDGNGLLFLDQECGDYEVQQVSPTPHDEKKIVNSKLSISSVTGAKNNSRFMGSMKKGTSSTNLPSFSTDRSALPKVGPSFSSKSLGSASLAASYHNSSVSSSPFAYPNETPEGKWAECPAIVTLDLPFILNNMRISRIPSQKSTLKSPEVSAIIESPLKVFKFLARELEFSYNQEKKFNEGKVPAQEATANDEEIKEDIMERFGLSENTTWAALVNRKNENDANRSRDIRKVQTSNSNTSDADSVPKDNETEDSKNTLNLEKKRSILTESINDLSLGVQQKIDLLMELIPICSHNASVYSYIDDIPNLKIWLLIRDSLLWDLKRMSTESAEPSTDDRLEINILRQTNSKGTTVPIYDTNYSETACVSGATSGINSLVEEVPQALEEGFKEAVKRDTSTQAISNLKQQFMAENPGDFDNENPPNLRRYAKESKTVDGLSEGGQNFHSEDCSTIEDDDDFLDEPKPLTTTLNSNSKSIPILGKKQHRPSFIDTFMTDVRSPSVAENEHYIKNRRSHSFTQSSPISKMSSLQSLNHTSSPVAHLKNSGESPELQKAQTSKGKKPTFGQLLAQRSSIDSSRRAYFEQSKSKGVVPPWNTKKLIKQLYKQAVEMGNVLLAVNILLLFQNVYHITTIDVVKNSLSQFTSILHQYELFEISAAILKYCPWDDIMHSEGDQSLIQLFCDKCGGLIANETSKEKFTLEAQRTGNDNPLKKFGYWYCDACKKPNTLCVVCERPIKELSMVLIDCGHQGHFSCLKRWFLEEGMTECPAGCLNNIDI